MPLIDDLRETDWKLTMTDTIKAAKPVAEVRVTHKGYGMSLATYVAYALPEGDHWLYAAPQPDRVKALEAENQRLREHFTKMIDACANYVEPTTYIARHPTGDPCVWNTEFRMADRYHSENCKAAVNRRRDEAFISDIIYMLDGPEQRAALGGEDAAD